MTRKCFWDNGFENRRQSTSELEDESIQSISDVYVAHYDDPPAWAFSAWMELTEKGERVARAL
jgi:hypothetical protein